MDARSPSESPTDLPRNLYFGAEDWVALQPSITDKDLALVRNQRHALVGHVTHKAERLLASVRTLKDFDGTGNAGAALAHVEVLVQDLFKLTTNLLIEIEQSEARYETAILEASDEQEEREDAGVDDARPDDEEDHNLADADLSEYIAFHSAPAPSPAMIADQISKSVRLAGGLR
ncbi:hypothetical protein [Arthrobacter sp. UYCu712]|uniref:hypothetical protein n=1 Tax=Arthrobacter sp. UYCu712 TaxID=3156340 RepID=UPI00339887BE